MVKKKESFNLKTTTALIIIIFILGMGGTAWFYAISKVSLIQTYHIEFDTVEYKHIGFNADPTLDFGKIPATGGSAEKRMNLYNGEDQPVRVIIKTKGAAAPFVQPEDNNFLLAPGEYRLLKVYVIVPKDFGKIGTFTGTAKVILLRE